jgi:hypothetical protein
MVEMNTPHILQKNMKPNYHFVHAKNLNPDETNPPFFLLEIQKDICSPELYQFIPLAISTESIHNEKQYLIQYEETGEFGYVQNEKDYLFENQKEIEWDVYHFFYMYYSDDSKN